jgi:hypothetical protein
MLKNVLEIFNQIQYKLQENNLIIKNVVFTKFLVDAEEILKNNNIELNQKKNYDNEICCTAKYNKKISDSLFLYSYFLKRESSENFLLDISGNIHKLYEASI